jgi:hypothetical protein
MSLRRRQNSFGGLKNIQRIIAPEMANLKQDSGRKLEFHPNVYAQDASAGVDEHIKSIPRHHSHILIWN